MEESTYHNRLVNLLFNTSTKVIRCLLHFLVQTHKDYSNLDDFLLKKKGEIERTRIGKLNLKTLFPTRKRPTNLDKWDLQLLCFIVSDIFKPEFLVQSSVDCLRCIRNDLCHGPSTKILKVDYEKTVKRIGEINDKLVNKIGDTNFKQEIATETDNIIHDKLDIPGALEHIRDWYELDDSHKQKCSFDTVHRQALQKLQQDQLRSTTIPETKLIIKVQNCVKEKEAIICKMLADNINRKRLRSEILSPPSDDETAELSKIIEDTFQEMLNEGQVVIKADVGCVILTVASGSFGSIAQLWTKCMNGELTKAFNTLQFHLRQIYKNQVELDVIVPEYEFWEVIDIFENPLESPNRSCFEEQVVNVITQRSFENGTEIEMVIQPHSLKQLEHMKEYSTSGKLDNSLKKMAKQLQKQLDLESLTISSKFSLKETKVRCVTCKNTFEETDTETLICGHQAVCHSCKSTQYSSTCTSCGIVTGADSALSANIGTMGLQETVSKPKTYLKHVNAPFLTGTLQEYHRICREDDEKWQQSFSKVGYPLTGDEIPVVSATDLKEPVHCGPIKKKEGILGLFKTRWCAIQNGTFFIFRKQSDRKQEKAFRLSGFKFRAKEKKDLCFELFRDDSKEIYQFKALCWEDYKQWQECIANGGYPLTGNPSFRDTDVNPNKQQTDRLYQRFHTFEPYKMIVTLERRINVRKKSGEQMCVVTGIEIIAGDRMVVCDKNNMSVKLIDTKQNIVTSEIRLPSEPRDIALVPRDVTKRSTTHDLIVTLPYDRQFRYIRVTNDQIRDTNKVIPVEGLCYGIQVTGDRKLVISYNYPGRVEIRDLEGKLLTTIDTNNGGAQLFSDPDYLAVSPGSDILYVSDRWNNTLTSISTRDWSVLTMLKGLDCPNGVTVDRAGSVFVCCGDGTVRLVAATGDRATRILGKEDGLCWSPCAICLSPEGDRMYVSCWCSDHVQEFRLTDKDNTRETEYRQLVKENIPRW